MHGAPTQTKQETYHYSGGYLHKRCGIIRCGTRGHPCLNVYNLTHFPENSEAKARLGILTPAVAVPSAPLSAACMAPRFFHAFSRKRSWKPAAAGASEEGEGEDADADVGRAAAGTDPAETVP